MNLHRFTRQLALCATLTALVAPAAAEDVIRIGILSDMSGPYFDIAGKGSVAAAQLAVEEFEGASAAVESKSYRRIIKTSPISGRQPPESGSTMRGST
jgi:hypothetical protein